MIIPLMIIPKGEAIGVLSTIRDDMIRMGWTLNSADTYSFFIQKDGITKFFYWDGIFIVSELINIDHKSQTEVLQEGGTHEN